MPRVRRRTGRGPRLIAGEVGIAHQTVWKIIKRLGLSRTPVAPKEQATRDEWPCPEDLLHMDTSRYANFSRPGHKMASIRDRTAAEQANAPDTTSATRSSMTTRAWRTSSCMRMSAP